MLVRIEHAFGRHELEDLDSFRDFPTVRARAVAQLVLGLGEADIDSDLALFVPGEQELQRDRGFSGAGATFQEMEPVARHAAAQHRVEAEDSSLRAR